MSRPPASPPFHCRDRGPEGGVMAEDAWNTRRSGNGSRSAYASDKAGWP